MTDSDLRSRYEVAVLGSRAWVAALWDEGGSSETIARAVHAERRWRAQMRPMVDFSLFRRRTFLGASVAILGFASSAQVLMTYLPLYLQNAFGLGAVAAGFGMLPFALPLFFCPRIAAVLAERISGRALLAIGLAIVALGNIATAALIAANGTYAAIAIGMVVTGCGAGMLTVRLPRCR
jgi:Na+/melibiose symporter-like transporter